MLGSARNGDAMVNSYTASAITNCFLLNIGRVKKLIRKVSDSLENGKIVPSLKKYDS